MRSVWLAAGLMTVVMGCQKAPHRLPDSSARPGEVVIVGDSTGALSRWLSAPEPGLPQSEPRFDVRQSDSEVLQGHALLARAIVVVSHKPYGVGHNLQARPQIVIEAQVKDSARILRDLMAFEAEQARELLERHGNPEMERRAKKQFGLRLHIPQEMRASKTAKDFLWMATNGAEDMRNLCILRLPPTSEADRVERINQVLSRQIHGETPQMTMRLLPATITRSDAPSQEVLTGLWEMAGDAMGGPFVASVRKTKGGDIVLLAFVYAPERKKRNIMRQLRAVVCYDNIFYGK